MNVLEWKKRYITQLIKLGLNKEEAEENYYSGYDGCNSDSPEDAADDEISYWKADQLLK